MTENTYTGKDPNTFRVKPSVQLGRLWLEILGGSAPASP
jgi:hypothetical protein